MAGWRRGYARGPQTSISLVRFQGPASTTPHARPAPVKTIYIGIGLVIGFIIGLIGASFVVDVMSR